MGRDFVRATIKDSAATQRRRAADAAVRPIATAAAHYHLERMDPHALAVMASALAFSGMIILVGR